MKLLPYFYIQGFSLGIATVACVLVLLIINLFASVCFAETTTDIQPHIFDDKWALVIGVDKFHDPKWNMKYAVKDAKSFQRYLIDGAHFRADHVTTLTNANATKQHVLEALKKLGARAKSNDLVLIYVRTRGTLPRFDPQRKTYFAASDTTVSDLGSTGIEMDPLPKILLQTIHAHALILIADADFGGVMARSKTLGCPSIDIALLPDGHLLQVICSAESDEITWESTSSHGSVFSNYLLAQLKKQGQFAVLPKAANSVSCEVKHEVENTRHRPQHPVSMATTSGTGMTVMLAFPSKKSTH